MSPARGALRGVLIWLGVAVFFAANSWSLLRSGEYTGLVGFAAFPIVGAIILGSRRGNGVGWLLYLLGMVWVFTSLFASDPTLSSRPTLLDYLGIFAGWYGWGCIPLIGLLFPTGRIETVAGRVLAVVLVGYSTLAAAATVLEPLSPVIGLPGIAVFVGAIIGIVVDLAIRWRRSSGVRRLQYRWLVWALALVVVCVSASGLLNLFLRDQTWVAVVSAVVAVTTNLIPIAIGIAITRHGLYEIGQVVSRTVSYAIVSLLVIGLYALIVTSATSLVPNLPAVGVALATLASAALFLPALRRVQHGIDRRFDRERYDAELVVDNFGERLRSSPDPGTSASDLIEAVETTLQPAAVGLWRSGGPK